MVVTVYHIHVCKKTFGYQRPACCHAYIYGLNHLITYSMKVSARPLTWLLLIYPPNALGLFPISL